MSITNEQLEELIRLYRLSTPGPWEVDGVGEGECQILSGGAILADLSDTNRNDDDAEPLARNIDDARFIVELCNQFSGLLERLQTAEKALEGKRLREWKPKKGDCIRALRDVGGHFQITCGMVGVVIRVTSMSVIVGSFEPHDVPKEDRVPSELRKGRPRKPKQGFTMTMDLPTFYDLWEFVLVGDSRFERVPLKD